MALRNILTEEDSALRKKSRPVTKFDRHLHILLDDMADTLNEANGVGLAAPQVGILRKAVIVLETNVAEDEEPYIIELINPEIISTEGEQTGSEGCLSVPGYMGLVDRPLRVKVRYMDINGDIVEDEFEDFAATVICHENDHLDGILYVDKAKDFMSAEEYQERLRAMQESEEDAE